MENDTELLKCPFCGGNAVMKDRFIHGTANHKNYWIVCGACQARIQDRNSIKKTIAAWNRRVSSEKKEGDGE